MSQIKTSSTHLRPVTEVAVGILMRDDGSFLLGQRPIGKPYEGYWEFPGGKLESGESVFDALFRELKEELGIEIEASKPWKIIEHDYPHAYVRLHLHIVHDWVGIPIGLESQELIWQESINEHEPSVGPLLPATITILEMMRVEGITAF